MIVGKENASEKVFNDKNKFEKKKNKNMRKERVR